MLSEQLAFTLATSAVGFVSASFFCVGAISTTAEQIADQACMYWDFHPLAARALTAQRSQYAAGALLLVVSFGLQVAAALASSASPVNLPQWLCTWQQLVAVVLVATFAIAAPLAFLAYIVTLRKVLRISKENIEKGETEAAAQRSLLHSKSAP